MFPRNAATSFIAAATARFWEAFVAPGSGVSASAAAASTVACQVRKSLAVDSSPVEALEVMRRRRAPAESKLLAWKDRSRWRELEPDHVNDYVRAATGIEATAKDFRTWHATVLAAAALAASDEPGETQASRKRAVAAAMREVAEYLGNTPALARSAYVDPRVVDAYEEGRTIAPAVRRKAATSAERQTILERAVLRLLKDA